MAGFEPPGFPRYAVGDSERQRAVLSWTALRQRIALGVGPTADRWSTYPGDGLTPEKIVAARKQAHAGYPWQWVDLCEQEMERNPVIQSRHKFRTAWVHQVPWRIDPPDHFKGDRLADLMALWGAALINGLRTCWPNAMENLLAAPAYAYAACENTWEWPRTISFRHEGKEFSVPDCRVPVLLKEMHQRRFIFEQDTDEPMLWDGQGRPGLRWPRGKILFHRALGHSITERRGYMTAALWIAWALQSGWRDLIIFMHLYGLPQFALMLDAEVLEQPELRDLVDEGMDQYGQGKIPLWPDQAEVKELGQVKGEPLHPAVINLAENHLSVLITGSILAQTQGTGTGAYGMSSEHAVTAHIYRQPDGVALDRSIGEHLLGPAVEFNIDQLCDAFDAKPEQIRARAGWFGWKQVAPAPTVTDIIGHYERLYNLKFPLSATEISQRTGYGIGKDEDRIGPPLGAPLAGGGGEGGKGLQLTPTTQAALASVDEARASVGLGPDPSGSGEMKVAQLMADQAAVVAAGAAAELGQDGASAPPQDKQQAFTRDPADPGVMIALYPPPELAAALALPGGEAAPELHVTLAYLGRRSGMGALGMERVRAALGRIRDGALLAPLAGVLGGVGRFSATESSDGKDVVYASVDVPGLEWLRAAVVRAIENSGADGVAVRANHGFVPHLTLAYVDPAAPSPLQRLEPRPVRFTDFYLVAGEERVRFPLQETP